ncbi:MAG: hypothetical protein HZC37_02650 [Burkholderiales bacterium]|nr:hypothetical protein [Burkholderiales bacterium]
MKTGIDGVIPSCAARQGALRAAAPGMTPGPGRRRATAAITPLLVGALLLALAACGGGGDGGVDAGDNSAAAPAPAPAGPHTGPGARTRHPTARSSAPRRHRRPSGRDARARL